VDPIADNPAGSGRHKQQQRETTVSCDEFRDFILAMAPGSETDDDIRRLRDHRQCCGYCNEWLDRRVMTNRLHLRPEWWQAARAAGLERGERVK
jgi:hypothetical protein